MNIQCGNALRCRKTSLIFCQNYFFANQIIVQALPSRARRRHGSRDESGERPCEVEIRKAPPERSDMRSALAGGGLRRRPCATLKGKRQHNVQKQSPQHACTQHFVSSSDDTSTSSGRNRAAVDTDSWPGNPGHGGGNNQNLDRTSF